MATSRPYDLIENYIYIYQLDKYCILPAYPESIQDSLGSSFASENILARTAPIFSYSNSGPRTIQINLELHRDLMTAYNYNNTDFIDEIGRELDDDYIDTLIRYLQAMALPSYSAVDVADTYNKMVNPPIAAVRFGNEVFIKGVVNGTVGVTYQGAILQNKKYSQVSISFSITETEPQDANTLTQYGSMRPLSSIMTRSIYRTV